MQQEDDLVLWLVHLAKTGHPQNKSELLDSVQTIVNENKRTTPFMDKHVLGETWYKNFMRRHPAIVVRVPEYPRRLLGCELLSQKTLSESGSQTRRSTCLRIGLCIRRHHGGAKTSTK